ncbi:AtzE family amidohydrolase [Robbsia sp. KACC 23696]|uniref:AtzE family amidohydrolase n=1 Tax=Robbsia sp. KACC 23696 TaxID=3149231 RepID=UPI00325B0FD5
MTATSPTPQAAVARLFQGDATGMAHAVRQGEVRAIELVEAALAQIDATNGRLRAFTAVLETRAKQRANALDALRTRDVEAFSALPLAGVPFAVKNLFDIAELTTLAGSKIEASRPPARTDAPLIAALEAAGAILVGACNMDEYAYGFTTENSHHGTVRNPHDIERIAGGSSGGSAAAVAAGQVPISLGSDTNGSIRVPASLCGTFALKPTFGRLPRTGTYPFVDSLDHLGPFARSVRDLALSYDVMQQASSDGDAGCAGRPVEPTLAPVLKTLAGESDNGRPLRIAVLNGWFREYAEPESLAAVDRIAKALNVQRAVALPMVEAGRAAAFLITNAEGAALHLPDLRTQPEAFEPLSRDRFLAGALLPAAWVHRAYRVRRAYAEAVAALLADVDILLAPATPCAATLAGQEMMEVGCHTLAVRANMGILTQPISCIGLPVCTVPVWHAHPTLPVGVQIIGAPWREDQVLCVAATLERLGLVQAPVAAAMRQRAA